MKVKVPGSKMKVPGSKTNPDIKSIRQVVKVNESESSKKQKGRKKDNERCSW